MYQPDGSVDRNVYGVYGNGIIVIAERAFKEPGLLFITIAHEEAHAVWKLPDNKRGEPYYLNLADVYAHSCEVMSPAE